VQESQKKIAEQESQKRAKALADQKKVDQEKKASESKLKAE